MLKFAFPNWKRQVTKSGIQKNIVYVVIRKVGMSSVRWSLFFGWEL